MLPLDLIATINKITENALNQAEANIAEAMQILKGAGGQND